MSSFDEASTFVDAIVQDGLDTPAKLIPMYAKLSRLRLFAAPSTISAAEAVLGHRDVNCIWPL